MAQPSRANDHTLRPIPTRRPIAVTIGEAVVLDESSWRYRMLDGLRGEEKRGWPSLPALVSDVSTVGTRGCREHVHSPHSRRIPTASHARSD